MNSPKVYHIGITTNVRNEFVQMFHRLLHRLKYPFRKHVRRR
jgi:hypothetical protein